MWGKILAILGIAGTVALMAWAMKDIHDHPENWTKKCPECGSDDLEKLDSHEYVEHDQFLQYDEDKEVVLFRCKECGHPFLDKPW